MASLANGSAARAQFATPPTADSTDSDVVSVGASDFPSATYGVRRLVLFDQYTFRAVGVWEVPEGLPGPTLTALLDGIESGAHR